MIGRACFNARVCPALAAACILAVPLLNGCADVTLSSALACTPGTHECQCLANGDCRKNDAGIEFACVAGVCICPPGTLGCGCLENKCAAGLTCTDLDGQKTCRQPGYCPRGTKGCDCYADKSCDSTDGGEPMECAGGICVAGGCAAGQRGCPCDVGEKPCSDKADVCVNGTCKEDTGQTLKPLANLACYTPCEGDLVGDGKTRKCKDGLLDGCIGDAMCISGSCLEPDAARLLGSKASACITDSQCPFFQECVKKRCYSTCNSDEDCRQYGPSKKKRKCRQKVCRLECTAKGSECDVDYYCKTDDATNGFCHPLVLKRPDNAPPGELANALANPSVFKLTRNKKDPPAPLQLTVADSVGQLFVRNELKEAQKLIIRPTFHYYWDSNEGRKKISASDGGTPLNWLTVKVLTTDGDVKASATKGKPLQAILPGETTLVVQLHDPAPKSTSNPAYSRWEGRYEVVGENGTTQTFSAQFARTADGQWRGRVFTFASFGDVGLSKYVEQLKAWREKVAAYNKAVKDNQPLGAAKKSMNDAKVTLDSSAPTVGNALFQKWIGLLEANITANEFKAILRTTENGAWKNAILRAKCPQPGLALSSHACFPSFTGNGVGQYTSDVSKFPVPDGALSVPLTVFLQRSKKLGANAKTFGYDGRVITAESLQYPGNPNVDVAFVSDPGKCDSGGGTCVARLKELHFTTWFGGRLADPLTANCTPVSGSMNKPSILHPVHTPWLVPGFQRGTSVDSVTGERTRLSCMADDYPLDATPAALDPKKAAKLNSSFTRGNPIPDGRSIRRQVELIDGAVINQDLIFALVKETFPDVLRSDPAARESRYGYVVLSRVTPNVDLDALPAASKPQQQTTAGFERAGSCSFETLKKAGPLKMAVKKGNDVNAMLDGANHDDIRRMLSALVTGIRPPKAANAALPSQVHHYCHKNDKFDATDCPSTSEVTYFLFLGATPPKVPQEHADCKGSCKARLAEWQENGTGQILVNPGCLCKASNTPCNGTATACSADRKNLTASRRFFKAPAAATIASVGKLNVHYLCHDSGYFDTGSDGKKECKKTSKVSYFTSVWTDEEVKKHACQKQPGTCLAGQSCELKKFELGKDKDVVEADCEAGQSDCKAKGNCLAAFEQLKALKPVGFHQLDSWACKNPTDIVCEWPDSDEIVDLRKNKVFYAPKSGQVVYNDIDAETDKAFLYKSRFSTRDGTSVGFAPSECVDDGTVVPYCYDPKLILRVSDRINCAAAVYISQYNKLDYATRQTVRSFLQRSFAYSTQTVPGVATPVTRDGFERLFTELLVMLGDDALTRAFASRLDLADSKLADFPGTQFEPSGMDLGGKVGYEMYSLYQAEQYYRLALDRFFAHARVIGASLYGITNTLPAGAGFIDSRTAVSYIPRVIEAATRRSRALRAIADRYIGLNEPHLARHVLERGVASVYAEANILAGMMKRIGDAAPPERRAQIAKAQESAQLHYARSLRQMRSEYDQISDEKTFFGIPETFVPIPPMDTVQLDIQKTNVFDVGIDIAKSRLKVAIQSEDAALKVKRTFDSDKEKFKSEMQTAQAETDKRLREICGSFVGTDGNVYPATSEYSMMSDKTRGMPDPCGLVGNGLLASERSKLRQALTAAEEAFGQRDIANGNMAEVSQQVENQCAEIKKVADLKVQVGTGFAIVDGVVNAMEASVDASVAAKEVSEKLGDIAFCKPPTVGWSNNPGNCPAVLVAAQSVTGLIVTSAGVKKLAAKLKTVSEAVKQGLQVRLERKELMLQCEAFKVDRAFRLDDAVDGLVVNEYAIRQANNEIRRQTATVNGLRNEAKAIRARADAVRQARINVEAAYNDPTQRIIRNETVIRADRQFKRALREAYRATRIFEYYTSQSYAAKSDLLLIRMAASGANTLQDYLLDLEDAFLEFEYQFGQPDLRLAIISMRDKIVPKLRKNAAMTLQERRLAFQETLKDHTLKDPRGWLRVPFSTKLKMTSPITANHKVMYVEVELVGRDLGDSLGRVYLRQTGTGAIRDLQGGIQANTFPPSTAVVNTIFNGRRGSPNTSFNAEIYRNWRLRDRPLINTTWELIFNMVDEQVNKDIDLDGLQDVVLYIYYTDFTSMDTVKK